MTRKQTTHVIAKIRYERGVPDDEAPIECVCGWDGVAGRWFDHLANVGVRQPRQAWPPPKKEGYAT